MSHSLVRSRCCSPPCWPRRARRCAQTQRSGGGESQRIMQQYQQVSAEKTALQAQVAQMKKDLDGAKAELAAAKKERDELKARAAGSSAAAAQQVAQANASKEAVEKSLEQNKQRTAELVDRFKETIATLKGVESDRDTVRRNYEELSAKYDKCARQQRSALPDQQYGARPLFERGVLHQGLRGRAVYADHAYAHRQPRHRVPPEGRRAAVEEGRSAGAQPGIGRSPPLAPSRSGIASSPQAPPPAAPPGP